MPGDALWGKSRGPGELEADRGRPAAHEQDEGYQQHEGDPTEDGGGVAQPADPYRTTQIGCTHRRVDGVDSGGNRGDSSNRL